MLNCEWSAIVWWVVGCNHGIQTPVAQGHAKQVVEQKQHFTCLLSGLMHDDGIDFIGEEWGLKTPTIAYNLAQQRKISWANINTSLDDLDRLRIPRDYLDPHYPSADRTKWNEQRESFMIERISTNQAASTSGLIICGFDHLGPLSERLSLGGAEVSRIDYRTMSWYQPTFTDDTIKDSDLVLLG